MKRIALIVSLSLLSCGLIGLAQSITNQEQLVHAIQRSQIESNVPPNEVFRELLLRDVGEYLRRTETNDFKIEYEMLRDGPTQTGVDYPKFYLWIKAIDTNGILTEGAMRVAAREKKQFEVTHFFKKEEIVGNPARIDFIFPQILISKIRAKAGLKKSVLDD